ncbi:AMP-binding protein [Rhodococcus sp. T7]|uniref:AMP-binding protein n=1 Tax=Rhodococcus sp. T7 TaxID=627444 RepID=UPI001F1E0879|nr:AMP-binding protein [Rhodococcus sp. T7]
MAKPERPAVIVGGSGDTLRYGEFNSAANRLAHLFRSHGLERRDHVAFFLENGSTRLVADSAAERTGLYFTGIDAKFSADEVAWIINDSTARVVVTSARLGEVARLLPARCPKVELWLMDGIDQPDGEFEPYAKTVGMFPDTRVTNERLGVAMPYTSGTTGRPKGIFRPIPDVAPGEPLPVFKRAGETYQLRPGNVLLVPGPLHHSAAQIPAALTIRLGGTVVIMERFDAETFLEYVDRYRVTHSLVVPTMMSRMLALPQSVRDLFSLDSLEALVHGAAPCPTSVKAEMIDWLGPIVFEYYGASEANGSTLCTSKEWLERPGTVGKASLGEVVILDKDGDECPPRVPGDVWFRGATNFVYFNDEDKTAKSTDPSGTMSTTGDIGYLDEDGYLFLTDRSANVIISGGVNIYPQEIENVLANHPDVADVAVVGVPHPDRGEDVKAVVQLRSGVEVLPSTPQHLIDSCEGRLAKFKWPRSIDFVDEVPRTGPGKLDKKTIRTWYWKGTGSIIR